LTQLTGSPLLRGNARNRGIFKMAESDTDNTTLAANLTIAWLNNPNVRPTGEDVTGFLQSIHATLGRLSGAGGTTAGAADGRQSDGSTAAAADRPEPAVSVRKSLASRDRIISMIDGKPYSSLKRHLSTHGLTPEEYRERFGLKADYPMVAPGYAEKRREIARKIGLGSKGGRRKASAPAGPSNPSAESPNAPARQPRRKKLGIKG
jgi:predicted transcriptional regulator